MNKLLFAGIALAAVAAGPALAADLPVRQPVYAPPRLFVPYFNWTGCYLGLNGGYGWRKDHTIDAVFSNGGLFSAPDVGSLGEGRVWRRSGRLQLSGRGRGVRHRDRFPGLRRRAAALGRPYYRARGFRTFSGSDKLNGRHLRGRVGYAAIACCSTSLAVLPTRIIASISAGSMLGANTFTFSNSKTKTGYVVGAGVDGRLLARGPSRPSTSISTSARSDRSLYRY